MTGNLRTASSLGAGNSTNDLAQRAHAGALPSRPRGARFLLACAALAPLSASAQDFNGNGVRDSADIRNGTSQDCDHNGIPDEADLSRPDMTAAIDHYSDGTTLTNVFSTAPLDADLDGDLDLMVASRSGQNNSSLTLWRNDGGPALVFASRTTVTNALAYTVRAADLNDDGLTDVVASDAGFAQVVVMLATGPGTFAAPTKLTAGSRGTGLVVGDLDGDGDLDLAMPGFATNAVDVFRNNGDGTFAPRQSIACDQQPGSIALGDFTGDGLPDLAVGNTYVSFPGTGTVSLLRNTGGATFVTHATLPILGHAETSTNAAPQDVALIDINADGDADLLVSSKDSNSLRIYSNDGTGAFANTQTLGPLEVIGGAADRFLCADLDGDAAPELAWCDSAARAVRIYDNAAGIFVFARSYAAGSEGPVSVSGGDFSGDGVVDLVTSNDTMSSFSVFVGQGNLRYDAVTHIRRSDMSFYPVLADFTNDGVVDLAAYSTSGASMTIAAGLGDGEFGAAQNVPVPAGGHLLPRDLNNDGALDILSLGNSGNFFSMLNNGDGTFGAPTFPYPINVHGNWQTADVNNDGNLDFLWSWGIISNQPHYIEFALGDGQGGFAPSYQLVTPPFLGDVWTGDLTGDGYPELFVSVAAGIVGPLGFETLLVYPNNGDGTFGDYEVHAYDLMPNFAGGVGNFAWVDIDHDGDNDLLGASTYTWLYRNTNNQLEAPVQLGGFANYTRNIFGPAIYDLDQDGDLDFYGTATISSISSPALFFNLGGGVFGPRSALLRYRNSPDTIAIGDADGNGRPDILVKPQGYGDWYLHRNFASTVTDCNGNGIPDSCDIEDNPPLDANANGVLDDCEATIPGDLDGDGDVDQADLALLLSCYGIPHDVCGDVDGDGDTDQADLAALLANYGS